MHETSCSRDNCKNEEGCIDKYHILLVLIHIIRTVFTHCEPSFSFTIIIVMHLYHDMDIGATIVEKTLLFIDLVNRNRLAALFINR